MSEATPSVDAVVVPMGGPKDVRGLQRLLSEGRLHPDDVIAVTGKTEGTGRADDTSRVDADHTLRAFLSEHGTRTPEQIEGLPMVFTTGGIGILTPQVVLYSRTMAPAPADGQPRLAVGTSRSAVMQPEWTGTTRVLEENVKAIRQAVADGGMDAGDVEYVIGKAYHVPIEQLNAARAAGRPVADIDPEMLFRTTSGSAGLATAVAIDGMPMPKDVEIGTRFDLWSDKASFSANPYEDVGGAGPATQIVALGNHRGAGGNLRVGHAVVQDFLDVHALSRALRRAGMDVGDGPLTAEQSKRVVALYIKIGTSPDGKLRGRRQVIEHPDYGNLYKAAVAGAFAGMLQDNLIWISASATHQGPAGGGTLAVVVDVS